MCCEIIAQAGHQKFRHQRNWNVLQKIERDFGHPCPEIYTGAVRQHLGFEPKYSTILLDY